MRLFHFLRISLMVPVATVLVGLWGCTTTSGITDGVETTVNSLSDVTSSTSGESGQKTAFIETRIDALRYEAARGEGENLDSLAELLGEPDRTAFARWMHEHYAGLFFGLRDPAELLTRIEERRSRGG